MSAEEGERPHEIIIVRRHGGDHDGHHGGAWKIAYADFVTAMMAFFLVMWLVNSANEVTKSRVASYFNPIKMTDAAPSGRGLKKESTTKRASSPESKTQSKGDKGAGAGEGGGGSAEAKEHAAKAAKEEAMMADPFKALDSISTEGTGSPSGRTVEMTSQKTGDPFDPMAWEALRRGTKDAKLASDAPPNDSETDPAGLEKAAGGAGEDDEGKAKKKLASADLKGTEEEEDAGDSQAAEPADQTADPSTAKVKSGKEGDSGKDDPRVIELQRKVELMKDEIGGLADINVDVKLTSEGLLISLEDGKSVSMFEVGSAEPNPALVSLIGGIGQLLEEQPGQVIIRGYTDGRKFRGNRFDNWQLSTARAHMASYMLIRGGMSEERIRKIEGYGAAKLLNPSDPLAETNRRVEFVLSVDEN